MSINPQHIVVIGAANIDLTGISATHLNLGESNIGKVSIGAGGVGRNIADNFARLSTQDNVKTYLLSAIGDDAHGKVIAEQSKQAGIDLAHCQILKGHPSAAYFSIVDHQGEMSSAINDMSIVEHIDVAYLSSKSTLINQAKLIVLDANLPQQSIDYICQNFAHIPIFADPVSAVKAAKLKPHLQAIYCLTPNLNEAEILSGSKDLEKIANSLHQQGVKNLYITLGDKGISVSNQNGTSPTHLPAFNGKITNVNGAGDAFMAGLIYAFIKNMPQSKQIIFAQACAFLTAQSESTINKNINFVAVTKLLESQNDH